jgi:hypothetical protein
MRLITFCLACSSFVGCAPTSDGGASSADQAFAFSSFVEPSFAITVVDQDGAPLSGVTVSVEDVYQPDLSDDSSRGHSVYLRGLSDANGVFRGVARLPETVAQVDVVVHDDSGRSGPWSDSLLRDELGVYAPSSRQTRSVAATELTLRVVLAEESL